MVRRKARNLAGLSGGLSSAVGIVAVALFSRTNGACSTNVIVLADARITERSCAAYSVLYHLGVGLLVLGAVLITGAFILSLAITEQPVTEQPVTEEAGFGALPPGWFGDPTNRDKPVQWWDGQALVDRPPPRAGAGRSISPP
jgi:hypothetical protein